MGNGARHIDRLLPRHESANHLDLDWNVHTKRDGMFQKAEVFTQAAIRDISLEGALVEVDSDTPHAVGDHVGVRFEGRDGEVVIRHSRVADDEEKTLYGVKFVPDPTLDEALCLAVGSIRGHSAELANAWRQQN